MGTTNLVRQPEVLTGAQVLFPGTSVTTFVGKADKSSVDVILNSKQDYKIYPNKVMQGEIITVRGTSDVDSLFITDMSGRSIYRASNNNHNDEIKIETAYLSKGLYIVTFKANNSIASKKIIID